MKLDTINRIINRIGNTWFVKVTFSDNLRPDYIIYAGKKKKMHKYYHEVIVCNKGYKFWDLEKYCNTKSVKFSTFNDGHGKDDCPLK